MKILIIDDKTAILESLSMYFSEKGYDTITAEYGKDGLKKVKSELPDIVILDIRLPDINGLDALKIIRGISKDIFVIMITAFHDMETTVKAMQNGAFEYIAKPIKIKELADSVEKAIVVKNLRSRLISHKTGETNKMDLNTIVGKSKPMQEVYKIIGLSCNSKSTVLIQGETGTGKEVIAKAIHYNGNLMHEPFVSVNCCALVETLMESELFGHERGSFTDAVREKRGKFELARNGTIFLDEVGDLPLMAQGKLLRFLQEKHFERVGGERVIKSDTRIIAATNKNLVQMVREGKFRDDLYFRLNVIPIHVPPLRERKSDIPLLADFFNSKIANELGREPKHISKDAIDNLMTHRWSGNVRELENTIRRAMILSVGDFILPDHISFESEDANSTKFFNGSRFRTLDEIEKKHIIDALHFARGNKGKACQLLKISRPTLNKKIEAYNITIPE